MDFVDPIKVYVIGHYLKHACQAREKSAPGCLLNGSKPKCLLDGIKPNEIKKFCLTSDLKCQVI